MCIRIRASAPNQGQVGLTVVVGRVLVNADPVVVSVVALVTTEQVAGVHLVVARRTFCDAGLLEARLGVLALGARHDIVVPGPQEVVPGRQAVVVGVIAPYRDDKVVRVLASLPDAALVAGGVLEAEVGVTATVVVVPAAVSNADVCDVDRRVHGASGMR